MVHFGAGISGPVRETPMRGAPYAGWTLIRRVRLEHLFPRGGEVLQRRADKKPYVMWREAARRDVPLDLLSRLERELAMIFRGAAQVLVSRRFAGFGDTEERMRQKIVFGAEVSSPTGRFETH